VDNDAESVLPPSEQPEPARNAPLSLGLCLLIWAGVALLGWGLIAIALQFI
jgi:hypothetical protein